jgi:beta-glucosidase
MVVMKSETVSPMFCLARSTLRDDCQYLSRESSLTTGFSVTADRAHRRLLKDNPAFLGFGIETTNPGQVIYNEGIHVGYRYYESFDVPVAFPFGYGLSYTTFEYSNLKVTSINIAGEFEVAIDVRNTGSLQGQEVVQVYVKDLVSSSLKPLLELKGFTKLNLEPGESQTAIVKLDRDALKFYDEKREWWTAEKGEFEILVGSTLRDLKNKAMVSLEKTITWKTERE